MPVTPSEHFVQMLTFKVIENRKAKFKSNFVNFNSLIHYDDISANFDICNVYIKVYIVHIIMYFVQPLSAYTLSTLYILVKLVKCLFLFFATRFYSDE